MTRFATIFFDAGGVCLTNGWDTSARRSAARHFSLDLEELERQHQALTDALERGEQSLGVYLDRVVFHRHRLFSRDAFPVPGIGIALCERFDSRVQKRFAHQVIAALREHFGGHPVQEG